jgi:hypothetical protein
MPSLYEPCTCAHCFGGIPKDYQLDFSGTTTGPCDNTYPNTCVNLDGVYLLDWRYQIGECWWQGAIDSNPCGFSEFTLKITSDKIQLQLGSSGDQNAPTWEKTFGNIRDLDCNASHVLARTVNSAYCNMPSTVTITPVAPSLSDIGEWDCVLDECPCVTLGIPSFGKDECCYELPASATVAQTSEGCPCCCHAGPPREFDVECCQRAPKTGQ